MNARRAGEIRPSPRKAESGANAPPAQRGGCRAEAAGAPAQVQPRRRRGRGGGPGDRALRTPRAALSRRRPGRHEGTERAGRETGPAGSYLGSQGAEQGEQEAQGAPRPAARPWGPHRCAARRGHSGRRRRRRRCSRWGSRRCRRRCCRRRCPCSRRVPALIYSADWSMHDWKTTPLFKSPFRRGAFQKVKSPASFYYSDRCFHGAPPPLPPPGFLASSRAPLLLLLGLRAAFYSLSDQLHRKEGGRGGKKKKTQAQLRAGRR